MISESGKEGGAAMTDRQSVLTAEGLVKSFKRRRVVDQVHLEVRQGEVVGLLGPNGAGKTTTFYMMVGLLKPDSGRVHLDDSELTTWPMYRRTSGLFSRPSSWTKPRGKNVLISFWMSSPSNTFERARRFRCRGASAGVWRSRGPW
jgi:ABC-type glutathione transport system ATPase component